MYQFGAVTDEDELVGFRGQKVKDQGHSETRSIFSGGGMSNGSPVIGYLIALYFVRCVCEYDVQSIMLEKVT